ncbi:hypothetical protein AG1IA_01951 [Rhizoctonia solani AG-1 IA]|uniref:Uncharacterized protein n=1 Tax=Thanatephorus cucumeris (strain AG1-IA) TaxID=983506 RepID=L8X4P9_THACA|nr:hypothetical protein AG1IA_01951 [Rhizoctonia solani AG-1 IA]
MRGSSGAAQASPGTYQYPFLALVQTRLMNCVIVSNRHWILDGAMRTFGTYLSSGAWFLDISARLGSCFQDISLEKEGQRHDKRCQDLLVYEANENYWIIVEQSNHRCHRRGTCIMPDMVRYMWWPAMDTYNRCQGQER